MYRKKVIKKGQGSLHPFAQGLIVGIAQQRIQPDDLVDAPSQLFHLSAHQVGVTLVPAVAQDDGNGMGAQHLVGLLFIQFTQAAADIGPSGPVMHLRGHLLYHLVDILAVQVRRNTGHAGREHGYFDG